MGGSSLSTKGLVSGGGASEESTSLVPITSEPPHLNAVSPVGEIVIVIPTAINMVLMAFSNIIDNLRVRQSASLSLPSLYKRAYLVVNTTDEIAFVKKI